MTSSSGWKLWLVFLIVNLILLNIGLAFLWQNRHQSPPLPLEGNSSPAYQELEAKLIQLEYTLTQLQNLPTPTINPDQVESSVLKAPIKTKTTTYMPIPGFGSILSYNWVNLSGTEFYFNPSDFPGLIEVRFEANMRLFNGNGLAFLRLFDTTNGIEVWHSQVQTANQDSTVVVSDPLPFRSGNNLIVVQAKSLTADTTVFNSGRIKIVTKN